MYVSISVIIKYHVSAAVFTDHQLSSYPWDPDLGLEYYSSLFPSISERDAEPTSWSSNTTDWNGSGTLHCCQKTRMFFKKVGGSTEILNGWSQVKEIPVGQILMI